MSKVDLQDCVYIDDDNKTYITRKKKKPFSEKEILDNIQRKIKHYSLAPSGCMGCGSVFSLSLSLIFIAVGVFLGGYLVYSLIQNIIVGRFRFDDLIITLAIGISSAIVGLMGVRNFLMNYRALTSSHPSQVYSRNLAQKYYGELVSQHQIIEGQIIGVSPTEGAYRQITYRFETGDKHSIESMYLTTATKDIQIGSKAVVLYMNNIVNVLL